MRACQFTIEMLKIKINENQPESLENWNKVGGFIGYNYDIFINHVFLVMGE